MIVILENTYRIEVSESEFRALRNLLAAIDDGDLLKFREADWKTVKLLRNAIEAAMIDTPD